jgi:hypothetical protein
MSEVETVVRPAVGKTALRDVRVTRSGSMLRLEMEKTR